MGAVDHARLQQLEVGNVGVLALELDSGLNLLELGLDEAVGAVALAVDEGQDVFALLPAILAGEPTRGLGQEKHSEEEQDGRDSLQAPGNTEGGGAVNEGGAVGDVEHDQDTPGNGPLLSTDDGTTLGGGSQLGDVDGNLRGADTDAETVDETADNEHGDVLRGGHDDAANDPDAAANHDGGLATQDIGEETCSERLAQVGAIGGSAGGRMRNCGVNSPPEHVPRTGDDGTEVRTTRHGSGDATLDVRVGADAFAGSIAATLVEVAEILLGGDDGGHGRDIEAEEATANDGDGRDEVDVADLIAHLGRWVR